MDTRNEADWFFHSQPPSSHRLHNYSSIEPHMDAMGRYFGELLAAGMVEKYDPTVHGFGGGLRGCYQPAASRWC